MPAGAHVPYLPQLIPPTAMMPFQLDYAAMAQAASGAGLPGLHPQLNAIPMKRVASAPGLVGSFQGDFAALAEQLEKSPSSSAGSAEQQQVQEKGHAEQQQRGKGKPAPNRQAAAQKRFRDRQRVRAAGASAGVLHIPCPFEA